MRRCYSPRSMRRRQVPAELVQPVVVDAEVVRDLVHHGDGDLLDDLLRGLADRERRVAEDRDPVGQRPGGPASSPRSVSGDALVQPEQVGLVRGRRRPRRARRRCPSCAASSSGIWSSASRTASSNSSRDIVDHGAILPVASRGAPRTAPAPTRAGPRFGDPAVHPYAHRRSSAPRRQGSDRPPSSSGLGPRPFTAVARVRIPLGVRLGSTQDSCTLCSCSSHKAP